VEEDDMTVSGARKSARTKSWTACAVILVLGAAVPATRALPQALVTPDVIAVAKPAEVPFKLYRDYAIVVRGSAGEHDKLNFLIDTGCSSTVVDKSLARKLRLATSPRKISVFGRTVVAEEAVLSSLHLGPVQAASLPVTVQDLSSLQEALSARIDAVVGVDVLSRASFTVDYEGRKLIWGPLAASADPVPCDPHFPYPTVVLQVGSRTLRVYVDTGASELALFENRTGSIPGTRVVGEETRTTIEGYVVVKTVELQELSLGATHWARREGSLMEGSVFDGTMGPKWLGAKRIGFDFEHKAIRWEK
jgi:predicted aspartyl protease